MGAPVDTAAVGWLTGRTFQPVKSCLCCPRWWSRPSVESSWQRRLTEQKLEILEAESNTRLYRWYDMSIVCACVCVSVCLSVRLSCAAGFKSAAASCPLSVSNITAASTDHPRYQRSLTYFM